MLLFPACLNAQGWPANYGGVMLQGFYWDSFVDTQWSNIESQADELSEFFDLVWVPQSGNCNTTYNVMGYTPVYYYDQNSSFGTESQLRSMISALGKRGVGVIADVVVNHRGSLGVGGSWVDFPAETHNGVTYQMGLADICRDDDGGATARLYNVTGAADTGEDWSGMRDLDHTSKNVQDNVIAYLRFLKDELGYAGFRYDMTKGYAAKYTGLYNSTVAPQFSVGEYWDGNATLLRNWVDGTMVDGKPQSATFDFATRYAIRDACNGGNWSKLSGIGLASYRDYRRYAVTFVENHDTQYRDASSPGDPVRSYVEAANAYILTMPGMRVSFSLEGLQECHKAACDGAQDGRHNQPKHHPGAQQLLFTFCCRGYRQQGRRHWGLWHRGIYSACWLQAHGVRQRLQGICVRFGRVALG